MGRVPAPAGISYFDANVGCLVTEGPDVCDYKSRIKELDPNLNAYYDHVQEEWIVTQFVPARNQEEFLLSDRDLGSAYERVQLARNDRPGALTGDQLDDKLTAEQRAAEAAENRELREIAGDAAERLMHAFRKDGIYDHDNIFGPKPKPTLARKATAMRTFR